MRKCLALIVFVLLATPAFGQGGRCVIDLQSQGVVRGLDAEAFAPYEHRPLIDWYEFPCNAPDTAVSRYMHTPRWHYGDAPSRGR